MSATMLRWPKAPQPISTRGAGLALRLLPCPSPWRVLPYRVLVPRVPTPAVSAFGFGRSRTIPNGITAHQRHVPPIRTELLAFHTATHSQTSRCDDVVRVRDGIPQ